MYRITAAGEVVEYPQALLLISFKTLTRIRMVDELLEGGSGPVDVLDSQLCIALPAPFSLSAFTP